MLVTSDLLVLVESSYAGSLLEGTKLQRTKRVVKASTQYRDSLQGNGHVPDFF